MARSFDFVSHCHYYGILLWNPEDKMYNLWHVFAYGSLDDAKFAAKVRDGIVVRWYWPSFIDNASGLSSFDLPF